MVVTPGSAAAAKAALLLFSHISHKSPPKEGNHTAVLPRTGSAGDPAAWCDTAGATGLAAAEARKAGGADRPGTQKRGRSNQRGKSTNAVPDKFAAEHARLEDQKPCFLRSALDWDRPTNVRPKNRGFRWSPWSAISQISKKLCPAALAPTVANRTVRIILDRSQHRRRSLDLRRKTPITRQTKRGRDKASRSRSFFKCPRKEPSLVRGATIRCQIAGSKTPACSAELTLSLY